MLAGEDGRQQRDPRDCIAAFHHLLPLKNSKAERDFQVGGIKRPSLKTTDVVGEVMIPLSATGKVCHFLTALPHFNFFFLQLGN